MLGTTEVRRRHGTARGKEGLGGDPTDGTTSSAFDAKCSSSTHSLYESKVRSAVACSSMVLIVSSHSERK